MLFVPIDRVQVHRLYMNTNKTMNIQQASDQAAILIHVNSFFFYDCTLLLRFQKLYKNDVHVNLMKNECQVE